VQGSLSSSQAVLGARRNQFGQAMSEFVVTVAFAFLPLFVLVPTLGKVLDLNFQNQMAARYAVWERTVWFDNLRGENRNDYVVSSSKWESVAVRSESVVETTLKNRFFLDNSAGEIVPISAQDTSLGKGTGSEVWTYMQSRRNMYGDTELVSLTEEDTPGYAYGGARFFAQGISSIMSPINRFLSAVGNDNEDLFTFPLLSTSKGFYNPTIKTQLDVSAAHGGGTSYWDREEGERFTAGIESAIYQNWNGELSSQAAILADGWSAQSVAYYKDRADDLVPSTLFNNKYFNEAKTIMSYLEGGPANSAIDKLGFGDVGIEPMPLKDGSPAGVSCSKGICSFEE